MEDRLIILITYVVVTLTFIFGLVFYVINLKNKEDENLEIEINGHKIPDPKLHQRISFLKSAIRIAGYVLLPVDIVIASVVLVVSEVIGIIEELV